jgi:hypothetical protein
MRLDALFIVSAGWQVIEIISGSISLKRDIWIQDQQKFFKMTLYDIGISYQMYDIAHNR